MTKLIFILLMSIYLVPSLAQASEVENSRMAQGALKYGLIGCGVAGGVSGAYAFAVGQKPAVVGEAASVGCIIGGGMGAYGGAIAGLTGNEPSEQELQATAEDDNQ